MQLPRLYEHSLTGRMRARPGWLGRQVLQVEVATLAYSACPPRPGTTPTEWDKTMRETTGRTTHSWRDATWDDTVALTCWGALVPRSIEPSEPWPRMKKGGLC